MLLKEKERDDNFFKKNTKRNFLGCLYHTKILKITKCGVQKMLNEKFYPHCKKNKVSGPSRILNYIFRSFTYFLCSEKTFNLSLRQQLGFYSTHQKVEMQ